MRTDEESKATPEARRRRSFSIELVLVIALPLISVFASLTSAYLAVTHGFTPDHEKSQPHAPIGH